MGNFVLKRKLKFDEFSENWKGCYIEFREPTVEEIQRMAKITDDNAVKVMTEMMGKCFISGKAFDGKEIVDLNKDSLINLPNSIFQEVTDFFTSTSEKQEKKSKD